MVHGSLLAESTPYMNCDSWFEVHGYDSWLMVHGLFLAETERHRQPSMPGEAPMRGARESLWPHPKLGHTCSMVAHRES